MERAAAAANGAFAVTLTITLRDARGGPVSGQAASLMGNSGSHSVISAASGLSDIDGVVTFSATDLTAEPVTYDAIAGGVTIAQTATVTIAQTATVTIAQTATVTFEPMGDVNLDGSVTATDALCILRDVAGLSATMSCPEQPPNLAAADVNGDAAGIISTDALCVLRIVAQELAIPDCAATTRPSDS